MSALMPKLGDGAVETLYNIDSTTNQNPWAFSV